MNQMTIKETADWLAERNNFLVLTHLRPDGDTLGSAAGLCQGLTEMGKIARMLPNPETTETYAGFMMPYLAGAGFWYDHVISIDTAGENQFQINGTAFSGGVDLCIDHHVSNTGYAKNTCVDSGRASCGEVIYEILMTLSGSISAKTAKLLYIAVSTDTGCFCYGNTNALTLDTAARLVEAGAPNALLNKKLFRTKSKARLQLEAEIISAMEYYFDGAVGVAFLTQAMRERSGAREEDTEDIASMPGQVEGVRAGITLRELAPDQTKISVRTTAGSGGMDANIICQQLGGGGHPLAAGCTVEADVQTARDQILKVIGDVWKS